MLMRRHLTLYAAVFSPQLQVAGGRTTVLFTGGQQQVIAGLETPPRQQRGAAYSVQN
jgi:hypothetical protein